MTGMTMTPLAMTPLTVFLGIITPIVAYAVITLLHIAIPAKRTKGYVVNDHTGEVLNYRVNGKYVLIISIVVWFLLGYFNIVPYTWIYETRWWGLIGAVIVGLIFTLIIVLKHPSTGKPLLADLWFGREKNPQVGDGFIDAKLWLYLVGVVLLQLNVFSCAAYQIVNASVTGQSVNPGFIAGCAMLTWFCFDYLIFEKIHLWTYDFIAERVGFKLGFGCLTFYPYFYAVALWFTAALPNPNLPIWLTVLFCVLFLLGWTLTRGANMQKYFFKTQPGRTFLGIAPEAISDGNHTLLVNGYWGASRHINYLGEILQALAIALVVGHFGVWEIWLYPAYYIGLMVSRQIDDNKVCAAKYGELWDEYTAKVKYRIVPFIY
jgi:delta14-sterol reductase